MTAPVSGHVKRVVVHEGKSLRPLSDRQLIQMDHFKGDSINQGDLVVEIMH